MNKEKQFDKILKFEFDDLLSNSKESVSKIRLEEINSFLNFPYKVIDDEKMLEMVESIRIHGIMHPIIVRRKLNDRYEIISGHRRKRASELAGKKDILAFVKDLNDEDATILMVDSNLNQREKYNFSEKAFAYKMKLEAMNKKAGRHKKNNLTPMVSELRTNEILGKENNESREQVRRYIRLTMLMPELLDMVDRKRIAFRPAVEISYLSKNNQMSLIDLIQCIDATPSLSQAIKMKKLEQLGRLNEDMIEEILSQEKPNQIERIILKSANFEKLFPKNIISNKDKENFIIMCIKEHNSRIKK